MKEIYFVDYNQNIYDKNGNIIGRIGNGYIVDRTRSDLIFRGEELGKFINIRNREEIEKFNMVINKEEVVNNIENLEVNGLKTVMKEENGILKNYVVTSDGHIYDDNNSYLNFNEKRKVLLIEWLDNPLKSSRIADMTPEELDEALIESIKGEYKEYSFEDTNKLDKEDEKKRIANEHAVEVEGRVNGELGIIENGVYDNSEYSAVEERNDGYVVVNPTVVSNNLKSTEFISSGVENINDVVDNEKEVQQREMEQEKYYYMDAEGNIYDSNGNMLEGVDSRYVMIDEENNLFYQNQKVGIYGGTLDDLAQNIQNSREKGNVRTLKKDNNAGFGQIIVVALVLLCLVMFTVVIALSLFG